MKGIRGNHNSSESPSEQTTATLWHSVQWACALCNVHVHNAYSRLFISCVSKKKLSSIHADSGLEKSPWKLICPIWTLPLVSYTCLHAHCIHASRNIELMKPKYSHWRVHMRFWLVLSSSYKWTHSRVIDLWCRWMLNAPEIIWLDVCGIWWMLAATINFYCLEVIWNELENGCDRCWLSNEKLIDCIDHYYYLLLNLLNSIKIFKRENTNDPSKRAHRLPVVCDGK